jgi:hypothetical protein
MVWLSNKRQPCKRAKYIGTQRASDCLTVWQLFNWVIGVCSSNQTVSQLGSWTMCYSPIPTKDKNENSRRKHCIFCIERNARTYLGPKFLLLWTEQAWNHRRNEAFHGIRRWPSVLRWDRFQQGPDGDIHPQFGYKIQVIFLTSAISIWVCILCHQIMMKSERFFFSFYASWRTVKGGNIVRTPGLGFPDGFHIQLVPRNWPYFWSLTCLVHRTERKIACVKISTFRSLRDNSSKGWRIVYIV